MKHNESQHGTANIIFLDENKVSFNATYAKPIRVSFEIDFTPKFLKELEDSGKSIIKDDQGADWQIYHNWCGQKLILECEQNNAFIIVDIEGKYQQMICEDKELQEEAKKQSVNSYWEWYDYHHPEQFS
jgi:hypothetical protein